MAEAVSCRPDHYRPRDHGLRRGIHNRRRYAAGILLFVLRYRTLAAFARHPRFQDVVSGGGPHETRNYSPAGGWRLADRRATVGTGRPETEIGTAARCRPMV